MGNDKNEEEEEEGEGRGHTFELRRGKDKGVKQDKHNAVG